MNITLVVKKSNKQREDKEGNKFYPDCLFIKLESGKMILINAVDKEDSKILKALAQRI